MNTNQLSRVATLIGEPARTAMLVSLMDGRALTANELARAAGIGAPTASRHLALLVEAGLVTMWPQGRHRYHHLASEAVARSIEDLMVLTQPPPVKAVVPGPRDAALRRARTCYDHIAGRLGVALAQHLGECGAIELGDGVVRADPKRLGGQLARIGLPMPETLSGHTFCRPCMDWSERQPHLAGGLGRALCAHALDKGWLARVEGHRALRISATGSVVLRDWMGTGRWLRVVDDENARPSAGSRIR
ncbi:MAG: helix-turn-helix transcriptional regulator [Hydrogenophaga sp.]|nr:helix-turn-helix transcriptional regulator [Hydrogenophaga sp.]